MTIRPAHVKDAAAICSLVNYYAERGRMLHRSMESVYDAIREFHVAVVGRRVVGCVAIDVFWSNLAEVKSLAVSQEMRGKGVGRKLVQTATLQARALGIARVFALTYEKEFFLRLGFQEINRDRLPEKVWRECIACPKVDCCDEIAMMMRLNNRPVVRGRQVKAKRIGAGGSCKRTNR